MRSTPRLALALLVSLAAGAGTASDDPPPEALIAAIPFEDGVHPSQVMIDLAPEDNVERFVMLLETGADGSVLTVGMARSLGVNVRATRSSPYRRKTRLGRDLQFWVDTSASDTGTRGGSFEYGLLGGNFLDDYVLEVDYPGRVVRFYDPKKYRVPEETTSPDAAVLPFRRGGTRILVELTVEGKPVLTLLDTGAPAVLLSGSEARKAGIDWKDLPELEDVRGVLGPIRTHTYEASRLELAGFAFDDQPIAIAPRGVYNQGGPTDSALGYDLLGQFVLRIDYRRKRIWLRRGPVRATTYWGGPLEAPDAPDPYAPTPEEVTERDARAAAEWEQRRDERYYAETAPGRFVVVDGPRLRMGPREGEVWYTHEEMLARKDELEEKPGSDASGSHR